MAENISAFSDIGQVFSSVGASIVDKFSDQIYFVIFLGKILTIILIIYFVILIISKLMNLRDSHNIKLIALNVKEINDKLSQLIEKKKPVKKAKS